MVRPEAAAVDGVDSRRYRSPLRASQAAKNREKILAAAADLVRGLPSWDWRGLTVQAVADRAGVARRTVYRHFPSENDLRAHLAQWLRDRAGVRYEGADFDALPEIAVRVVGALADFPDIPLAVTPKPFPAFDAERVEGIRQAVASGAPSWGVKEREGAAAALDAIWAVPVHQILLRDWGLRPDEAFRVQRWLHDLVVEAISAGRPPDTH